MVTTVGVVEIFEYKTVIHNCWDIVPYGTNIFFTSLKDDNTEYWKILTRSWNMGNGMYLIKVYQIKSSGNAI